MFKYVVNSFVLTIAFFDICIQAFDAGSLQALDGLMNEFFATNTTNERKREIGKTKSDRNNAVLNWN